MSPRKTRSQTKAVSAGAVNTYLPDIKTSTLSKSYTNPRTDDGISRLPTTLTRATTGLTAKDHRILLRKQAWLRQYSLEIPAQFAMHAAVPDATLVFAQEEAGTAVCIAPNGMLLTCSHCVAETIDELDGSKDRWLLFRSGSAVKATCVAWDDRRDLALLQIIATQRGDGDSSGILRFPHVGISVTTPAPNMRLMCVGHPGSEDLEASQPGIKTNYDVLHVSAGRFRGYAEDQDLQDNSEIGALMHDCWTYWGHSGAPLLDGKTGMLIGLHSSWDDETGMRRGVPLEAILEFLEENKNHVPFTSRQKDH
ncbi:putative at hook domain-containing protein family protein [Rosellinia necatrix]|uniref:Putative at hook domain-containing protein family protein n=1 Tax=Rosellinia necatrix TaxID=77044 RepID=A0A1S8A8K6_ROSNE|nr:putative at hook domain-containing protein family protein [Rosellinia necatrix]